MNFPAEKCEAGVGAARASSAPADQQHPLNGRRGRSLTSLAAPCGSLAALSEAEKAWVAQAASLSPEIRRQRQVAYGIGAGTIGLASCNLSSGIDKKLPVASPPTAQ